MRVITWDDDVFSRPSKTLKIEYLQNKPILLVNTKEKLVVLTGSSMSNSFHRKNI